MRRLRFRWTLVFLDQTTPLSFNDLVFRGPLTGEEGREINKEREKTEVEGLRDL